ncbi:VRR-NUC domain-containing protein [Pseudomonas vanderleydeniana]|uniref:VRR-NUC domain-containing protein n=1 Tax=Pseudomonas vanderleydeniana TaxID=2745495 RepID=A0A9E6PP64_9PSED|nr:VRR-NUC domain-containing protein [Pseudomonas vanderleydeniana]QXI30124.1 VRR-NUC domain-containing protein [Pseudomonas vanderleydeniana]
MPGPVAPVAASALIAAAYRAYRGYQAGHAANSAADMASLARDIVDHQNRIKQVLREALEAMSREIEIKSSTLAVVDRGGNSTVSRRGDENLIFKEYIERKVPFRPVISQVCNAALQMPIKVPRRLRKKIAGELVDTTIEIALKQTTASLLFEAVDEVLDWRSPLKAEPNYNKNSSKALLGDPPTRPKRFGKVFPFWPRPWESLAPDLVVVEYRQEPFETENVFAAVEIKFPRDWAKQQQMKQYVRLMMPKTGINREKIGKEKVALLRVPEDCVGLETDNKKPNRREDNGRRR